MAMVQLKSWSEDLISFVYLNNFDILIYVLDVGIMFDNLKTHLLVLNSTTECIINNKIQHKYWCPELKTYLSIDEIKTKIKNMANGD